MPQERNWGSCSNFVRRNIYCFAIVEVKSWGYCKLQPIENKGLFPSWMSWKNCHITPAQWENNSGKNYPFWTDNFMANRVKTNESSVIINGQMFTACLPFLGLEIKLFECFKAIDSIERLQKKGFFTVLCQFTSKKTPASLKW